MHVHSEDVPDVFKRLSGGCIDNPARVVDLRMQGRVNENGEESIGGDLCALGGENLKNAVDQAAQIITGTDL